MGKKGLIQVYTGNGKGKTTAALGQALRAIGHGWRAVMFQFMKGDENYGEVKAARLLPNFAIIQCGRCEFVDLSHPAAVDRQMAADGWDKARTALASGQYDLVILDEINVALACDLLPLPLVLDGLAQRAERTEVILTGRYAPADLLEVADLVTEMAEVKHPYTQGVAARCGIEY